MNDVPLLKKREELEKEYKKLIKKGKLSDVTQYIYDTNKSPIPHEAVLIQAQLKVYDDVVSAIKDFKNTLEYWNCGTAKYLDLTVNDVLKEFVKVFEK